MLMYNLGSNFIFVCHIYACLYVHLSVRIWRQKVNVRFLSQWFFILSIDTGSLTESGIHQFA